MCSVSLLCVFCICYVSFMQTIYVSENPVESFPIRFFNGAGPVPLPTGRIAEWRNRSLHQHKPWTKLPLLVQHPRYSPRDVPSVILKCSRWWSTVLISKKQHVSSWASLSSFHPTLCQGSIKDVISAAQSGGDSKSPMQSPVIATTSGKPIHQTGGKTKKHNDNYFFFIRSPTTNMAPEKWWLPDDSFLFGLLGLFSRVQ